MPYEFAGSDQCKWGRSQSCSARGLRGCSGWDDFADANGSTYTADVGVLTATLTSSNTSSTDNFQSTDGTFGTLAGTAASTDANAALEANRDTVLTIVLTNNSGQVYNVTGLHLDWAPDKNNNNNRGPRNFYLNYDSGGLGDANTQVAAGTNGYHMLGTDNGSKDVSDYPDFDFDLTTSLTDYTLANGESATFTMTFDNDGKNVKESLMDNVAFTGGLIPEPASLALLGLGGLCLLRRR